MRLIVMAVAGVNILTMPFALGLPELCTKLPKVSILLDHTFCAWSGRIRRPSVVVSRNSFFTEYLQTFWYGLLPRNMLREGEIMFEGGRTVKAFSNSHYLCELVVDNLLGPTVSLKLWEVSRLPA